MRLLIQNRHRMNVYFNRLKVSKSKNKQKISHFFALPDVVDRLDSLQALHEQALQFSKTLVQLDSLQQKLESNLSTNQKTLEETKTKFSENLGTIQKNFDTIDQRLTKLKK